MSELAEIAAMAMALLLLSGCDVQPVPQDTTSLALKEYRCSKEQMDRVQSEALFCDKNTSYLSTYCYSTAIIRNCTKGIP